MATTKRSSDPKAKVLARHAFTAELWRWESTKATQGSWFFVSLPEAVADEVDAVVGTERAGFGSVPVEVTIGSSTWRTSIFPDSKRGTFVLPVKKQVRTTEGLQPGTSAAVELAVLGA